MPRRAVLAALLGGAVMFLWSSLAHEALPLGRTGIREIPNEQGLLSTLHASLGETPGLYMFPGSGGSNDMQQYARKLAANPSGLLIYHPPGERALTPGQLATEFLTELAESLLAVFLLAQTRLKTLASRVGFVTAAGFLAALATNVSYWNWYGFPTSYTLAYMTTQVVGFAAVGITVAVVMKNRPFAGQE